MGEEMFSKDRTQLEALLETIKKVLKKEYTEDFLIKHIEEIRKTFEKDDNSLYARCIEEICYMPYQVRGTYVIQAINICNHYLSLATGEFYNSTKYHVEYRKKNVKQLNIDLTAKQKEEFKEATKKNGKTMKGVIKEFILQYIEKNK